MKVNFNHCCLRVFAHRAPQECSRETAEQQQGRLQAMQKNIKAFLKSVQCKA